jgi:hypothetical protein
MRRGADPPDLAERAVAEHIARPLGLSVAIRNDS